MQPEHISAWYLLYGCAMALLIGNIDINTIHIIGTWYNDKMVHYLNVTERLLMKGHATNMVTYGD